MLIDTHVHVGQFYETYYSPTSIIKLMANVGVDYYAVSSTTTCEENYEKVLHEMEELVWNDEEHVLPVLWITPDSLKGNIVELLDSNIKWRCVKVHPFLHPNDWDPKSAQFDEVIDVASELNVPILIHTGMYACCHAGKYDSLISKHQDVIFILAHGRPLDETIYILKHYDNAYADSAFMPVEDMITILHEKLSEKLLWGTDMMIPQRYYPQMDMVEYYKKKLDCFARICDNDAFQKVTWKNAKQLLKIY